MPKQRYRNHRVKSSHTYLQYPPPIISQGGFPDKAFPCVYLWFSRRYMMPSQLRIQNKPESLKGRLYGAPACFNLQVQRHLNERVSGLCNTQPDPIASITAFTDRLKRTRPRTRPTLRFFTTLPPFHPHQHHKQNDSDDVKPINPIAPP